MQAQDLAQADFADRSPRVALAGMAMRLFDHWGLSNEEQLGLLGLDPASRATLARYRKGQPLSPSRDLIERAGHLLAIHKSLRIIFPHNRELAYGWMKRRNRDFDNLTPVDLILQQGFAGLLMVRAYLDRARGN